MNMETTYNVTSERMTSNACDPSVSLNYIAIMPVNGAELYKKFGFGHAGIPKGNN